MNLRTPQPNIERTLHTWNVPPGMTFALVEDCEGILWIREACPIGVHYWTLAQAAELTQGTRTRPILQEAVREGRRLEALSAHRPASSTTLGERRVHFKDIRKALVLTPRRIEADSFHIASEQVYPIRAVVVSNRPQELSVP